MEMHIVHKNRNYSNLSNALNYKDGLVVLGVFFQVSWQDKLSKSFIFHAFYFDFTFIVAGGG